MYAYIGETLPFLEFRKSLWLQGIFRFQLETMVRIHGCPKSTPKGTHDNRKGHPTFGSRKRCLLSIVTWFQTIP